jgi:hypothetical protein
VATAAATREMKAIKRQEAQKELQGDEQVEAGQAN